MHDNTYLASVRVYCMFTRVNRSFFSMSVFSCVHPLSTCMDIAAWSEVCMSTILDGVCVGCPSMCVLLSVRSSRRQQGAPFQFTHQPQRQGVKARGIAVGDFTFEGRDYQSGDPCVDVMRETAERCGGSWDCWGDGGLARGGRAAQLNTTLESVGSLFSGEQGCQAAHLFDTRRCGMAVRACLYWFTSLRFVVFSKNLDDCWSSVRFFQNYVLCGIKWTSNRCCVLSFITTNYCNCRYAIFLFNPTGVHTERKDLCILKLLIVAL